jgi:spore maturation protein CgeB
MRIAVLGAGGAHKTEESLGRAARSLGHACRVVDALGWTRRLGGAGARLARRQTEAFEPDFVLVTRHAIRLGEATVRALVRGRPSAFWYFDLPATGPVVALGRLVDAMYVTSPGQLETYRAAGIGQVAFLPQGLDPAADHPAAWAPPWLRCDASFVGSGQYPHRHTVLRAVARACDLQIRGPGWQGAPDDLPVRGGAVRGRAFARVVRGAAISLGANALPEQDREYASASNRMWKILGCGGFYLGQYVAGIDRFARHGEHCAWYRSADEAVELVRRYLADPEARARIAAAGRAHALARHTYAQRLALLLAGRGYPLDAGAVSA